MKKEYYNLRFCDDSRTIRYDILYTNEGYAPAHVRNQGTTYLAPKEYFMHKLQRTVPPNGVTQANE